MPADCCQECTPASVLYDRELITRLQMQVARKGKRGVWLKDFGQALAMYWVLIQVRRHTTMGSQLQTLVTVLLLLLWTTAAKISCGKDQLR